MERDAEKLKMLERWKTTLQDRHTVATFHHGNGLAVQVAADLAHTIADLGEAATRKRAHSESGLVLSDEVVEIMSDAMSQGVLEVSILSSIRRAVSILVSEAQSLEATVFLSYALPDREIVRQVAKRLSKVGLRVWFDVDSIPAGSEWAHEIERGLDSADFVLFFMSKKSVRHGFMHTELRLAFDRFMTMPTTSMFIIPILLEQTEVPPLLRDIQWLDMTDGDVELAVARLLEIFRRRRS